MRKFVAPALLIAGAWLAAGAGSAETRTKLPDPMRSIEAVNVERPFAVITGTVTVRSRGVLVNPPAVTYSFYPDFKGSAGHLFRVADGVYVLRAGRVPSDRGHVLTIRGAYNDTVIRNGLVEHLGRTYTGTLRVDIPHGRDYSFGDQLLDLR